MPIDLYYLALSPPCRTVMMTAHLVGADINLKVVNLLAGEQHKPEFLKMNPRHTVPFIDDNGFYMSESQAICGYLVGQYAKNDKLFPQEAQQKALVDKMLMFDDSVYFAGFRNYYVRPVLGGAKKLDMEAKKKFHEALAFLEGMLSNSTYAAGDHLTVADLALVATTSSFDAVDEHILDSHPHIQSWFNRCRKEIDCYEEMNGHGAKLLGQMIRQGLSKLEASP